MPAEDAASDAVVDELLLPPDVPTTTATTMAANASTNRPKATRRRRWICRARTRRRSARRSSMNGGWGKRPTVAPGQAVNPVMASPISFTPIRRQITAMITAFSRAIQARRPSRMCLPRAPMTK